FLFMTSSPTTLYTLSLHDALPISLRSARQGQARQALDRAPSRSRPYRRGARGLTHGAFLSSGAREPAAFGGWPEPGAPRLRPVTPLFIPPAREATGSGRAARRARGGRLRSA